MNVGMLLVRGGEHHVDQFILVLRRHGDDVRHAAQIGDVEQAVMRRAVVGGKPGAVHAENHRQILQAHVVMNAIVGALEEGGINRADRVEAHRRHAGGEDDGVFLGDADVVVAVGHRLFQMLQAGAAGHGGGDADERVVLLAEPHQRLAHDVLLVRRRARLWQAASRPVATSYGPVP